MFFMQFVVGFILILIGVLLWLATSRKGLREWFEKALGLEEGDSLFDKGKFYSIYILWGRYVAFFTGVAMIVPTRMLWDVIIGMIAAGIFWWMNRQKTVHDREVAKTTEGTTSEAEA